MGRALSLLAVPASGRLTAALLLYWTLRVGFEPLDAAGGVRASRIGRRGARPTPATRSAQSWLTGPALVPGGARGGGRALGAPRLDRGRRGVRRAGGRARRRPGLLGDRD